MAKPMKKNQVIIHSSTVQLQDTVANAHGGGKGEWGKGGWGRVSIHRPRPQKLKTNALLTNLLSFETWTKRHPARHGRKETMCSTVILKKNSLERTRADEAQPESLIPVLFCKPAPTSLCSCLPIESLNSRGDDVCIRETSGF